MRFVTGGMIAISTALWRMFFKVAKLEHGFARSTLLLVGKQLPFILKKQKDFVQNNDLIVK
jgi:hypothetical protein